MTAVLTLVAAGSLLVVALVYAGYPLLLLLLAAIRPAPPVRKRAIEPGVSLLISCHNEEQVIGRKLENALALDYPSERLEIIVVSDASTDRTEAIAEGIGDDRVRLVRQDERRGKTAALNLAVPRSRGEIVVFSDANAFYEPDAIHKLVRNFHDPSVGYVVGDARYVDPREASGRSERMYWSYEGWIKRLESRVHSIVGGDGAIYAIRRELYQPLEARDINDFVNPLQIVLAGRRGVYEPEAVCHEETAGSFDREFRRKTRIVNRSFSGLMRLRGVLNPGRTGLFAVEVLVHKLLRWLAPVFLIALTVASLLLALLGSPIFTAASVLIVAFYLLFYAGYMLPERVRGVPLISLPYYFVLVNAASLLGVWQSLRGRVQVTWSPPRADVRRAGGARGLAATVLVHLVLVLLSLVLVRALPGLL